MSVSSRSRALSVPSSVSLNNPSGSRASRRPPPPLANVVTVPPWAKDEPPSPSELTGPLSDSQGPPAPQSREPDAASFQTSTADDHSRWWSFTLPRSRDQYYDLQQVDSNPRAERRGFRDRSISWLQGSSSIRDTIPSRSREKEKEKDKGKEKEKDVENGELHLSIPPAPAPSAFTAAHATTPGWDLPWSGKLAAQGPHPDYYPDNTSDSDQEDRASSTARQTGWPARKKTDSDFHPQEWLCPSGEFPPFFTPLPRCLTVIPHAQLFRFINISFTTAALGMAIHIRSIEIDNHTRGAVGSSPTVVIIFAPLTLVHVMAAIYLEYFSRPVGLWTTSGKLTHTLSEVLFICLWSAALSLSFDNFFTSLVPCASPSSTRWYNELARPEFDNPVLEGSAGKEICQSQLALICLVGVGLIAYCANLIISLFRIFEKVKWRAPHNPRTR
ncbi:hypothetical protein BKA70DRAFT_1251766 [Coprinopsis sp. MPI-PUGE-AT-0042]|nr:hypothetical protein BKA70DRAFT_1251766 [Coprinopsis sp. MPI-PUGE-AT-0042]